nr:MAG TPA: tail repeat-like protein [Caudoviricetes sp.]
MAKKLYKKTGNKTYEIQGILPTETEWEKVVLTDTTQTITGAKTFNAPPNVNGKEIATTTFKTSNGGQLIIGKEGPNSGTMLRFDQTAGTTRLQFRASATPGAMVWSQPEKGAVLFFDLTDSKGVSQRTSLSARGGEIARTGDIGNGTITIQKNKTRVGSFTTNQNNNTTIDIPLAKSDVGLGNVDNTADKDKSVKHASSADDSTNAFNLVSTDKQTKYTAQDFLQIYTDLDTKMPAELHDLSYGIFFRNSEGLQYTGIAKGDIHERRMIATFDNTTNPLESNPDIGHKMVDLGTAMSAGVDANDSQNFGGAIFANFIGPNNSVGEYSDVLKAASKEASDKFKEKYGTNLDGGFGCLAGTAKGSIFTSRIDSSTGDIYTSALMFKPNVDSNDQDFQVGRNMEMRMPCFSIYNGIQVTTSGYIYNKNDVIDPLRERNNYSVAFLAYSKTGKNVDIDRLAGDYQPKGSYVTTNTAQTISAKKTFSTTPVLSAIKNKKVLGTDANGLVEAHTLGISDITNLQSALNGKANSSHTHSISQITNLQSTLNGKQATLVSGTNIRTINGYSILGSGNLSLASLLTEKEFSDIMNATSSKSSYIVMDKLLIQWGVYIGAHGDTTDWEVTYPKIFWWYPAVILQTRDTVTGSQGIPYSNGAVITSYRSGTAFTFQLRRSEACPVYWIAIGGLQ